MDDTHGTDSEQTALWNGAAGRAWVDAQEVLDRLYAPLKDLLVDAVAATSSRLVLDVGCGTGSTTLAVARMLGATGRCVGIDISEPMIALARTRAEQDRTPAEFIRADAQGYVFEPGTFDLMISRFGVMFFNDPVQAFSNLKQAAVPGAHMRFITWRSAADNPFMTTAERAAAPLLPNLPSRRPDGPGQFAFANRDRVHSILHESGWTDIDIRPLDVALTMPETDLVRYVTRLGPVGLILQEADDRTRALVLDTIRPAFDSYVHGADVRFTAACWTMAARAGNARSR